MSQAEHSSKWYANNRETQKERVKKRKIEIRRWFDEYKKTLCCSRCPENHPACLDFHHRDPSTKEMQLGNAVTCGWSKERILREVAKCEVLCANCHRKEHASYAEMVPHLSCKQE